MFSILICDFESKAFNSFLDISRTVYVSQPYKRWDRNTELLKLILKTLVLLYILNTICPRTETWCTPLVMRRSINVEFPIITLQKMYVIYYLNYSIEKLRVYTCILI